MWGTKFTPFPILKPNFHSIPFSQYWSVWKVRDNLGPSVISLFVFYNFYEKSVNFHEARWKTVMRCTRPPMASPHTKSVRSILLRVFMLTMGPGWKPMQSMMLKLIFITRAHENENITLWGGCESTKKSTMFDPTRVVSLFIFWSRR